MVLRYLLEDRGPPVPLESGYGDVNVPTRKWFDNLTRNLANDSDQPIIFGLIIEAATPRLETRALPRWQFSGASNILSLDQPLFRRKHQLTSHFEHRPTRTISIP
jgi:hypothetical protein